MIAWAMKDIAFTPKVLDRLWLRDFPNADVLRLPDAGHYLQEDAHERIVPKLLTHLDSVFHTGPADAPIRRRERLGDNTTREEPCEASQRFVRSRRAPVATRSSSRTRGADR